MNIQNNSTKKNGLSASFTGTNKSVSVSGASHSHDSYTGYTQPTFTGTAVTSGANNRDHTHTINSGNTSSSGTTTTAGFRGVAVTSGANSRGHSHSGNTLDVAGTLGGWRTTNNGTHCSGPFTLGTEKASAADYIGSSTVNNVSFSLKNKWTGSTSDESQNHTHGVTASGYLYGKTDGESQNHTHSVTAEGTVQNHRHSISSSGTLSMSGTYTPEGSVTIGAGDSETRPDNYTYTIWKRIA